MENEGSSSGGVLQLASQAEENLVLAADLLKSRARSKLHQGQNETHWDLFLETGSTPADTIETCAISVGADALLRTGEPTDSGIIQGAGQLVKRLQRKDGGWTSFVPSNEEESLTLEAYFAIRFLTRVNAEVFRSVIEDGVKWLVNAENPNTGGWGFFAGDTSKVLPTAYTVTAICASAVYQKRDIAVRDSINRGVSWLLQQQNKSNGSWNHTKEGEGSAVQTSVVLRAVLGSQLLRSHSQQIIRARNWLLEHLDNRESIADLYRFPVRDSDGNITGQGRRINHVTPPEAVILESLLYAGTDVLDRRLLGLVKAVISSQRDDGSWPCPQIVNERPIFAIWEAVGALQKFIELVKRDEHILAIKEQVEHLNERLSATENRLPSIEASVVAIEQYKAERNRDLNEIQKALSEANQNINILLFFREGLSVLRPLGGLTHLIKRFPLAVFGVLAMITYVIIKLLTVSSLKKIDYPDMGLFLIAATVVVMDTIRYYRDKKPK